MSKGPLLADPAIPARVAAAQIHDCFLERSETFIYHMVAHFDRFQPVFIAREYRNLEQFPIPAGIRFSLARPAGSWDWLRQGVGRRILGRELLAEGFLKKRNARLLHAHFGHNGAWALRLKSPLGLPLVTTFYGYDMSQALALDPRRNRYQELFAAGDLFLVEGPFMRRRLAQLGCREEKIAIQRIAIPLSRFAFKPRLPKRTGEAPVLLFSGRFVEKKGLLPALQAVSEVHRVRPNFEFRIIGDGPLRLEVEQCIQEQGMAGYVRLLGFLNYNEYIEQMKNADLFLQPSRTAADGDSEGGAPTTLLEAQALGLPVASTTHADIPHVVLPGESALLSPEQDVDALAANIERLLADPHSWSRMGAAGRRFVEDHHDVSREIPRLESRYAELIANHAR